MSKIAQLRKKIDVIDDSIIKLLNDRFSTSKAIFKIKEQRAKELNSSFELIDYQREDEIISRQTKNFKKGKSLDISHRDDEIFVQNLMSLILSHSKKIQIQK